MTSHKPLDLDNTLPEDQWRVWTCFHFCPNDEAADSLDGKLVCRKNTALSQAILDNALRYSGEPIGPYLAGVAAHVFADTFAHFGFIGLASDLNKVQPESVKTDIKSKDVHSYVWNKFKAFQDKLAGSLAGKMLPLGHVESLPFLIVLTWTGNMRTKKDRGRLLQGTTLKILWKRPSNFTPSL